MKYNRIYLVGFTGAGKSTFGKKIAHWLSWKFIDLDFWIEQNEGLSISEIFEIKGEAYFRKLEHLALLETSKMQETVVACGGGTPIFFNQMDWINEHGLSIYINTSKDNIIGRLRKNQSTRPMLKRMHGKQIADWVHKNHEVRSPIYQQSKISFDSKNDNFNELVLNIRKSIE